jgi:WS/DGAT/MGAT family acyltransferase
MTPSTGLVIDRVTPDDVVALATDVGPAPMQVGAVLVLDTLAGMDLATVHRALGERISRVPRLRQRLITPPIGCGRSVWIDDADFDLDHHLHHQRCPGAGSEDDLLALAAEVVSTRLPPDRPLWTATFVSGLEHGRAALIVVLHHVLSDGIGGLAVLANLVDGAPPVPIPLFPRTAPGRTRLLVDAMRGRARSARRLPSNLRRTRDALVQLRPAGGLIAATTSLNRPTGRRRQVRVVRADLAAVHDDAREHGVTVNDVVLAAVADALHRLLLSRGERIDRFVISIPVSARRVASAQHLGNEVGAVPVQVPATGPWPDRLAQVARATRRAKQTPAVSVAVLGPVFRLLAGLGIFSWFIRRQRLVHTFVTNLRGPAAPLTFLGAPITDLVPLAIVTGNVTVSFAVLSYVGTLTVAVIGDPDTCPDLDVLAEALGEELRAPGEVG